jgi:hypothetical protein
MKRNIFGVLLIVMAATLISFAQGIRAEMVVNIPFSFIVEGKTYPAGSYDVAENTDSHSLSILSNSSTQIIAAPYLTRLSARSASEAEVVFDVVGPQHYLSEVYMPSLDGFQLDGAPGIHTHTSVMGHKKTTKLSHQGS